MASNRELAAMRRAIILSAHGLGTTSPNPPVGCVILDSRGDIAGTGYHRRKGEPHAEANALVAAGDRAKGGTAVVTLEPCNHVGRTPPCHQGLLNAGIERVIIALIDPTSRGEGGAAKLRSAGVDVEVGVLADEARLVLGPWLDALASQRPLVTAVLDHELTTTMRASVDVVLFADGRVEEAVPNSHGAGALDLPDERLSGSTAHILKRLHAAGARSILLVATEDQLHDFATAHCLDRIVVSAADDTEPAAIPNGFHLTAVNKLGRSGSIECVFARQD